MTPAVELRSLCKRFGPVTANADISLKVERGSIHAVIGENGAGKSTAMKMLYGIYRPDEGEILVDGERRRWKSSADAIRMGIGMVHQHFMLADPYDSLENIWLGAESSKVPLAGWFRAFFPVDRASMRKRLEALSRQYGLEVPWDAPSGQLPIGVRQRVEILKLLYRDARILILDEPTAVLTPQETADLFANLRRLKAEGKTVIIITHKLKEVMAISDRITVFRAGRVVANVETAATSVDELATLMVGRKVELTGFSSGSNAEAKSRTPGKPLLEVRGVSLGGKKLQDLHFEVKAGEVVGVAGVEGNGQSELLQLLTQPKEFDRECTGEILCLGRSLRSDGRSSMFTLEIKDLGVGVIPEDRHRDGLLLGRPVSESFLLGLHRRKPFESKGLIDSAALEQAVLRAGKEYDIRPSGPRLLEVNAGGLSGGNQQKVIIAREFERNPKLLIAAQPTRGVDVGAIEFIHRRILRARDEGAGVLLISSELDEILGLSDRILVMYGGRIVASLSRAEADEKKLGLAMGGAL